MSIESRESSFTPGRKTVATARSALADPGQSFYGFAAAHIKRLAEATRTTEAAAAARLLEDLLAPWGGDPIGKAPRIPSDIGDDQFPIEFSVSLSGGDVELRVLWEARGSDGSMIGRWNAAQEVNVRLEKEHGVSLARFRSIEDLFVPLDPCARYAMWHSVSWSQGCEPRFKIYLNPQAQGPGQAPAVICEAVRRLGFSRLAQRVSSCARDGEELKFFSLDADGSAEARVKVYKAHHGATRGDIERELSFAHGYCQDTVRLFFETVAEADGPFCGLPLTTYLALTSEHSQPSGATIHFPIRDYAENDEIVSDRIGRYLSGEDRAAYERILGAFAGRALRGGAGMHSYVALGLSGRGPRVTIYLSPEAYRVNPARGSTRPVPVGERHDASDLIALTHPDEPGEPSCQLLTDGASRRAAARDAGGLVSLLPGAVLRPSCVEDVVRAVRFCAKRRIKIAARGQGHTAFGQAQVEGGLVVDMTALDRIHSLEGDHARVDAGTTWRRLLTRAIAGERTPPVLTGFQGLTVGGTLSVGGISGASYKRGAQIDHVTELEVVTGDGELVTCGSERNGELYRAVLGGGGRAGFIVRATIPLVVAPTRARHTLLSYGRLAPFLRDLRELVRRRSLDGVSGTICLLAQGGLRYELNALSFFTPPEEPETSKLLEGIGGEAARETTEFEYLEYCLLVDRLMDRLCATSGWNECLHPWFDVFLPDAHVEQYLGEVLGTLDPAKDVGPPELGSLGQLHLFPLLTEHLHLPWLRVPGGDLVFLFDILTSTHGPNRDPLYPGQMIQRNRRLFEKGREFGAMPYSISAIPMSRAERIEQIGPYHGEFDALKRRYDPFGILRDFD